MKPTYKKLSMTDWVDQRFNNKPDNILEEASGDISNIASDYNIDWRETKVFTLTSDSGRASKIPNSNITWLDSTDSRRGRVAVWAYYKTSPNGVVYPVVNFTMKGGQQNDVWSGYDWLKRQYDISRGVEESPEDKAKRRQELAAKEQRRREQAEKDRLERERIERAKAESVQRDIDLYNELVGGDRGRSPSVEVEPVSSGDRGRSPEPEVKPTSGGDRGRSPEPEVKPTSGGDSVRHPYAIRKRIANKTLEASRAVFDTDHLGYAMILPLVNMYGELLGVQKVYPHKVKPSKNADETDKVFTWGLKKDAAHIKIGDVDGAIERGERIGFSEGYATGAAPFQNLSMPMVVCLDSGNLKKVVDAYFNFYPDLKATIWADNDHWKMLEGKGNAGLLAAIECQKKNPKVKIKRHHLGNIGRDDRPTDWNDIVECIGDNEIKNAFRKKEYNLEASNNPFEYALQRIAYSPKQQMRKEVRGAIFAGMGLMPVSMSSDEMWERIVEAAVLPFSKAFTKEMRGLIYWLAGKKISDAKKTNNFSSEIRNRSDINFIKVKPEIGPHGGEILPANMADRMQPGTINILRSGMGTAKTQSVMAPLLRRSQRGVIVAHRTSLIAELCNKCSEEDEFGRITTRVSNYQDITPPMVPHISQMGICINSIANPKFSPMLDQVDTYLNDEASQTLRSIADGTIQNPVVVLEKMEQLLNRANMVVLADADANDNLVNYVQQACPGKKINIWEMDSNCSNLQVNWTNPLQAHQSIVRGARDGKKILVADDSVKDGEALKNRLETEVPGTKVLHVEANTKGELDVKAFLEAPQKEMRNWDVIIYSPAITSGISITEEYFDLNVGIFFGSVAPSDAIQMIRRDRTATRFILGVAVSSRNFETDQERILEGLVAADEMAGLLEEKLTGQGKWEITETAIVKRFEKHKFDDVWLNAAQTERASKNDFGNMLMLLLIADGYKIERIAKDEIEQEIARYGKKAGAAIAKARMIEATQAADPLSESQAKTLKHLDDLTLAEAAALRRHDIENQLVVDFPHEQHIAFWDDGKGMRSLANMEALQAGFEECAAYDNHLVEKRVVLSRRKHKAARNHFLTILFDSLGIDKETGEGDFTTSEARKAVDALLVDQKTVSALNELRIAKQVNFKQKPKCAMTFVKIMLNNLGLDVASTARGASRTRHYSVKPESWTAINDYLKRRREAGISTLTIKDDAKLAIPAKPEPSLHQPMAKNTGDKSQDLNTLVVSNNTINTNVFYLEATDHGGLGDYQEYCAMGEHIAENTASGGGQFGGFDTLDTIDYSDPAMIF